MFYGCPFHRTYETVRYQQNLVTYDICKKLNNRGRYREENRERLLKIHQKEKARMGEMTNGKSL